MEVKIRLKNTVFFQEGSKMKSLLYFFVYEVDLRQRRDIVHLVVTSALQKQNHFLLCSLYYVLISSLIMCLLKPNMDFV